MLGEIVAGQAVFVDHAEDCGGMRCMTMASLRSDRRGRSSRWSSRPLATVALILENFLAWANISLAIIIWRKQKIYHLKFGLKCSGQVVRCECNQRSAIHRDSAEIVTSQTVFTDRGIKPTGYAVHVDSSSVLKSPNWRARGSSV